MNVLFTNYCNRNCAYCFAKGKLASSRGFKKQHISFKNLKTVINFLKTSRQADIGILGGEPTLHPHFKRAFGMILQERFIVSLFSNGIISTDILTFLQGIKNPQWTMVLNINHPASYTRKESLIIHNLLRALKKQILLSFNICRKDFNGDFLIELIKKYGLSPGIRLAMALPQYGHNNQHIALKDYRKVATRVVRLAEKCDNADISIYFDCGFLLCSFTEEEFGRLFRYNSPLQADCVQAIDVAPDLTVWKCFATGLLWNKKLTDFSNLAEVNKFYIDKFRMPKRLGVLEQCFRCKSLLRKKCGGGCLGHSLTKYPELAESIGGRK
ncbi:radical SAM protein [Candidatus Omnitrophota bacterium]